MMNLTSEQNKDLLQNSRLMVVTIDLILNLELASHQGEMPKQVQKLNLII